MKDKILWTLTSLLTILLTIFHLTDDIVYRISPGRFSNIPVMLVWVVWVYATLVLAERRSGYVLVLVLSLLAAGLPVIHMMNPGGVTAGLKSGGAFFYAWTLLTVGVTAVFSVILSARGLWSLQRVKRMTGPGE